MRIGDHEIEKGDVLIAEDGLPGCMTEGHRYEVREDADGILYVNCGVGEHSLDGLVEYDGQLVGFRLVD